MQWCDIWAGSVRHAAYAALLAFYLGTGGLLSKEGTERVLGRTYERLIQWNHLRHTRCSSRPTTTCMA